MAKMTKLVVLIIYFTLQYSTTSSFSCWYSSEDTQEHSGSECDDYSESDYSDSVSSGESDPAHEYDGCPENESFFSKNDIKLLIDHIATNKIKLQEDVIEIYYKEALEVKNKYFEDLNKFQELIENQPKHIKHFLEQIENERLNLKPIVKEIEVKLEDINVYQEQLSMANIRLEKVVKTMDAFETICNIQTANQKLLFQSLRHRQSDNIESMGICGTLADIYNQIFNQLSQFEDESMRNISALIEEKKYKYEVAVATYNDELKKRAMRNYKNVMYDILKLQDEYIHFKSDINAYNITEILNNIKNNLTNTDELLNELEEQVLEYGKLCMENHNKFRNKRAILDSKELKNVDYDKGNQNVVDQLVQIKINDVSLAIQSIFANIFEELDNRLFDPNVIDLYSEKLLPTREDLKYIAKAQEKLQELKELLVDTPLDMMQKLLKDTHKIQSEIEKTKKDLSGRLLPNFYRA